MIQLPDSRLREYIFVTTYVVAALLVVFLVARTGSAPYNYWVLSVLAIAAWIIDYSKIEISESLSISLSFPIILGATIAVGPMAGVACALASSLSIGAWRQTVQDIHKPIFNSAQFVIASGVSGMSYVLLEGHVGLLNGPTLLPSAIAIVTAAGIWLFLNSYSVATVIELTGGPTKRQSLKTLVGMPAVANNVAMTGLGLLLSQLIAVLGPPSLILLAAPLNMARYLYTSAIKYRETYLSSLAGMVKAIEAKDHYTRGHSERVAKLSLGIAHNLKLSDAHCELVRIAALLHDIGKICVPGFILRKPSALTNDEFCTIKTHPSVGADICRDISFLEPVHDAIRLHHERVDGKGYYGVSLEALPLFARILAVADAYDAMTIKRSYRDPSPPDVAFKELEKCSGSQFDPAVVAAIRPVVLSAEPS